MNVVHTHKQHLKISSLLGLVVLLIAALSISGGRVLGAGSAGLSLSPGTGSYANNTTFTMTVNENSGVEAVDSASIDVIYDAGKLQYISANNGSAFQLCVAPAQSSGKVSFGCTTTGSTTLTGSQSVGTLSFKVLSGSGSTAVTFGSSSSVIRHSDAQNIWDTNNTVGGTYNFTTPAPTATPTPSASPSATPPAKPTAGSGAAKYGSLALTTVATSIPGVPNIAAQQANPYAPIPVGKPALSDSGQMVAIRVTDNKTGKPLSKTSVSLDGQKATTDATGVASFTNVRPGSHKVTLTRGDKTETKDIVIRPGQPANGVQQFEVHLASVQNSWLLELGAVVIILLILVIVGYLLIRRLTGRNNGSPSTPVSGTSAPIVTSETTVIHPAIDKEV